MNTNDAKKGLIEAAIAAVVNANTALQSLKNEIVTHGPIFWVNIYKKGTDTLPLYFTGSEMYVTEERAKLSRGTSNSATKNKYLGAFPVDFSARPVPAQAAYTEPQYVSLADMSYDQQQAFLTAAKLFYKDNRNKIFTIKHIRTLSNTCTLMEGKQLVEWAIGGDGMRPSWGKVTSW